MSEAGDIDTGTEGYDRDWNTEARAMGWHPQEEYNGPPDKWVDSKTFVTRGENQLPIMRENNRKLAQRVRQRDDDNAELRNQMAEMRESLSTMRTMMERGQEVGYERAKSEFESQMRQAVANGDVATFDKLNGEMERLDAQHEKIITPPPKAADTATKGPKSTPEFQNWFAENGDWVKADPTLGRAAVAAETELRQSDEVLSEGELWDRVTEMVQTKYPRRFAAATGGTPQPTHQANGESAPRRAAAVLSPSGGSSASTVKKGGIDSIADPDERKVARAAYQSIKRGISDYTEAEYMKVYVNPGADVIGDAVKRKVANGKAH